MFIDRHKRPNIMKDCKKFLEKIEELKPYLVEFNEDSTMKKKNYPANCAVNGSYGQPVIIITHDECKFFANNGIRKVLERTI